MTSDSVWLIVRYVLLIFFTSVLHLSDGQITKYIGLAGDIFTAGWGLWVKWGTKAVPQTTAARIDVPTVSPITGTRETAETYRG